MEYLQYKDEKETLTLLNGVLNLIINGISSIHQKIHWKLKCDLF